MNKTFTFTNISTSGTSDIIDYSVGEAGKIETALVVTASSGTPTLDIDVEISYDKVTWIKTSNFTQATGVTTGEILEISKIGKFARFKYTVGGGTPVLSFKIFTITKDA